MKLTLEFEYEIQEGDLRRIVANVNYRPGRPPPHCSNPDHPAFSDPGDPDELEIIEARLDDGTSLPREILEDARFVDDLYERARDTFFSW